MVPDIVAPGLDVLFCGINPGLTSGQRGQHFARPGNRFWKLLHLAGFTDRVLRPSEQDQLTGYGVGITNLVARTSRAAADLTREELREGGRLLEAKVEVLRPGAVAVLGAGAYRTAFGRPRAAIGPQREGLGPSALWVLPNPSGLQAAYSLERMVELFTELRARAGQR